MADQLTADVAALLREAGRAALTEQAATVLADAERRLSEPLRLAIAGKVKAGKSTLLNALLAEELAPTDAGECTRIVTWYRRGDRPQVLLHDRGGSVRERPFDRSGGAVDVDLGGCAPQDVDHLEVRWPSERLRDLTLLDTPGIASISADVSAATTRALTGEDDRPSVADGVIYLLRHTHASDVRFLESFHDDELAHGTPVNTLGVLARADEIGACRLDAMDVAERIAARYRSDERLRRLCPAVLPVSGLLAHGGVTLREQEFRALAAVASAPRSEQAELLLTADRFARRPTAVPVTPLERQHLLGRLGLFGVRLSVELLGSGAVQDSSGLAAELVRRSGLTPLRRLVVTQFAERSQVLKARSALAALATVLAAGQLRDPDRLRGRAEEVVAGAHALVELRLLTELRSGGLSLPDAKAEEAERVLGGSGHESAARLGLPADATGEELAAAATEALVRWRRAAEHPLASRGLQRTAQVVVRSLEGLIAAAGQAASSAGFGEGVVRRPV